MRSALGAPGSVVDLSDPGIGVHQASSGDTERPPCYSACRHIRSGARGYEFDHAGWSHYIIEREKHSVRRDSRTVAERFRAVIPGGSQRLGLGGSARSDVPIASTLEAAGSRVLSGTSAPTDVRSSRHYRMGPLTVPALSV